MQTFLIILVSVLGIIAILQMSRVYDLTRGISKQREEDIVEADIRFNGNGMGIFVILLMIFFVWLLIYTKGLYLPEAASIHGVEIDKLMNFNWWIVIPIFVIMNILLFGFTWKYQYRKNRKAFWFPHNNKLELIWTVVPAVVLAVIIIWGLRVWNRTMMTEATEDAIHIELYGKQFDWTIRYAGEDGKLGACNYNFISGTNTVGIMTTETRDVMLAEINEAIVSANNSLTDDENNVALLSLEAREDLKDKRDGLLRKRVRILAYNRNMSEDPDMFNWGKDDKLVAGDFYIPVDKEILFHINSRDVIHSAYMPHFRMQMNAVPGQETSFLMTPTITTAEMKKKTGNPEFEYILLCNKICGASHYNMQRKVVVVSEEEYNDWLKYDNVQEKTPRATFAQSIGFKEEPLLDENRNNDQITE